MTVLGGQATGETPGNVALQVRITGPIHLTHAARTERFKDLVVTEGLADQDDGSLPGKSTLSLLGGARSDQRPADKIKVPPPSCFLLGRQLVTGAAGCQLSEEAFFSRLHFALLLGGQQWFKVVM